MPRRDGQDVALIPPGLFPDQSGLSSHEIILFCHLQLLNKHNDVERDGLAVFIVGPNEWKRLGAQTGRSVQTMKRWLKGLERAGWATVERIKKDTHRVTIYNVPAEKRNHNETAQSHPPVPYQGHPPQQ